MALKVIMMRHNLDRLNKELEAIRAKDETFMTREAELEAAINEVETDEQREAVAAEVEAFDAEKTAHEDAKADLTRQIEELETELAEEERKAPAINKAVKAEDKKERKEVMQTTINIRSLPMNQRAFDAIPAEQRTAILAQEDVKQFVYLSVKVIFDPPTNATVLANYNDQIKKLEWLLMETAQHGY